MTLQTQMAYENLRNQLSTKFTPNFLGQFNGHQLYELHQLLTKADGAVMEAQRNQKGSIKK